MSHTMTKTERERFLADVRVGMISIAEDGRGPLTVPIWYGYTPGGELYVWMEKTSRKALLLQHAGRFSLCVQTEQQPYQYVSVEGPITSITSVAIERDVQLLAHRYLGIDAGDVYIAESANAITSGQHIVVRMRPERWLTADYTPETSDAM